MAGGERWTTSVHHLMLNFRDALVALIPYMERGRIPWRDEEAYDDWDEIAQSLYKNMVLRSILFSTEHQDDLATPEYGTVYPSYDGKSFIEVVETTPQLDGYKVFVGFSTQEHPFDQVRYQPVSGSDLRATGAPVCIPLGETKFTFVANTESGVQERFSTILVEV